MPLHLIKLCVGVDSVDELAAWRAEQKRSGRRPVVHTRNTPKRAHEVLDGGSLFWVIKRVVTCRQLITAVDTREDGLKTRCELTLHDDLVLVEPRRKTPFQGWRYLPHHEAPGDLHAGIGAELPHDLAVQLRALGAW
jgi:hypothetical protein